MNSEPPNPEASDQTWRPRSNPWFIALAVMLATFIEVLDTTIVSVATPNIAGSLAATPDEATRVLTCYLIANAVILPASGWLSIRFGRKRLILACTALFGVASFLCGSAPSMGFLLACSALQGVAGGAMVPLGQAILMESFPLKKRGMALAVFSIGVVVAPALGPVVGGWLTDNFSWRWVFYINIPMCALAALMMWRFIEDPPYVRNAKAGSFDTLGLALIGICLGAFQLILDDGQKKDWLGSRYITSLIWICVIAFVLMLVRELRVKTPIVDLRVFLNRNFLVGCTLMLFFGISLYSATTGVPLFLQLLMGYTSQLAGFATSPRGIASFCMMPVVGYLMSRIDGRWIGAFGLLSFGIGTYQLGNINLFVSMSSIVWPCALQGMGMSCVFVPLMGIGMGTLRNEQMANASGLFNLMRNLGGSIGIALTNTFTARGLQSHYEKFIPHVTVYDTAYQQQSQMLQNGLAPLVGAHQAPLQAQGMIQGLLLQQASVMSYIDVFRWTAAMLVILAPTVFVLKRVTTRGGAAMH